MADSTVAEGWDRRASLAAASELLDCPPHGLPVLTRLLAELVDEAVTACWQRGWDPSDLAGTARRRTSSAGVDLVADVVRHLTSRFPTAFRATFDSYWADAGFEAYDAARDGEWLDRSLQRERGTLPPG